MQAMFLFGTAMSGSRSRRSMSDVEPARPMVMTQNLRIVSGRQRSARPAAHDATRDCTDPLDGLDRSGRGLAVMLRNQAFREMHQLAQSIWARLGRVSHLDIERHRVLDQLDVLHGAPLRARKRVIAGDFAQPLRRE